jgi:hypothetical protein
LPPRVVGLGLVRARLLGHEIRHDHNKYGPVFVLYEQVLGRKIEPNVDIARLQFNQANGALLTVRAQTTFMDWCVGLP